MRIKTKGARTNLAWDELKYAGSRFYPDIEAGATFQLPQRGGKILELTIDESDLATIIAGVNKYLSEPSR